MRWLLASWTAWVRRLAPSLSNTRLVWVFTGCWLTNSRLALSWLLSPSAIYWRTSSSRGVMPSSSIFNRLVTNGTAGTGTSTGSCLTTTLRPVIVSPGQMPTAAKAAATMAA